MDADRKPTPWGVLILIGLGTWCLIIFGLIFLAPKVFTTDEVYYCMGAKVPPSPGLIAEWVMFECEDQSPGGGTEPKRDAI